MNSWGNAENTDQDRANLIRELSEGYRARKKEDNELALEWSTTSGDGID